MHHRDDMREPPWLSSIGWDRGLFALRSVTKGEIQHDKPDVVRDNNNFGNVIVADDGLRCL